MSKSHEHARLLLAKAQDVIDSARRAREWARGIVSA